MINPTTMETGRGFLIVRLLDLTIDLFDFHSIFKGCNGGEPEAAYSYVTQVNWKFVCQKVCVIVVTEINEEYFFKQIYLLAVRSMSNLFVKNCVWHFTSKVGGIDTERSYLYEGEDDICRCHLSFAKIL